MTLAALLLLATLHSPEECVVAKSEITTTYGGRTYAFRFADCRDEFLTDPERFAQLYDALLEMQAEGLAVAKPRAESLVPS
ncbi:MAG TPA: hypothetical protein VF883_00280 [Thermoanaerobaculia bacterium]